MLTIFRLMIIMLLTFKDRVLRILLELVTLLDITVGLAISIPFYIILGQPTPDCKETISSVIGRYATMDMQWAKACEWFIDKLFFILTGRHGHCRYIYEELKKDQEN